MAQSSDLDMRLCLVWNTHSPRHNVARNSSNFALLGLYWNLQMNYDYNIFKGCFMYSISLHQGIVKTNVMFPFRVTTFIDDTTNQAFRTLGCTKNVQCTVEVLWEFPENLVTNVVQDIRNSRELTIVCLFHFVPPSMSQTKTETLHLSTRNDLPDSSDFPPNLENLSLDLSKLLKDETFPDVKLRCGDHTIPAHKAVLTARSQVFAAMFRNKMSESETGIVDVADMDIQVLELFLKYVYTGKITDLSKDMLPNLYAAGDKYAVHALKKTCSDQMMESLTEENCISFLTLADAHSDVHFKQKVISFICEHEAILQGDVWLTFSKQLSELAIELYQSFVSSRIKKP